MFSGRCQLCGEPFSTRRRRQQYCSCSCAQKTIGAAKSPMRHFEKYAIPEPNSGCWLWAGHAYSNGYGAITVHSHQELAHRYSYKVHKGPIPAGMLVMHQCDVRCCVNPDHLVLGTYRDNNRDCISKGRSIRGEKSVHAVLTESDVLLIRASGDTHQVIAEKFGVQRQAVGKIKARLRWAHVR